MKLTTLFRHGVMNHFEIARKGENREEDGLYFAFFCVLEEHVHVQLRRNCVLEIVFCNSILSCVSLKVATEDDRKSEHAVVYCRIRTYDCRS